MNAIKALRIKRNLTQARLAEELAVGQSTVAMWESGVNMPRADKLPKLAAALDCSINELFDKRRCGEK